MQFGLLTCRFGGGGGQGNWKLLTCAGSKRACQRQAPTSRPVTSIIDLKAVRVTFWKNILSLFERVGANGFEGAGLWMRLVDGWRLVCGTNGK